MATVTHVYIKPEFFRQCVTDHDWWPSQLDGSANLQKDYSNFTQVLFSLLPLKHFLAHSLSIQVTVNLPKTPTILISWPLRWGSILCMVKTSGRACRCTPRAGAANPAAKGSTGRPVSSSDLSPLQTTSPSPSVRLCPVIHFFHTEIRRFRKARPRREYNRNCCAETPDKL